MPQDKLEQRWAKFECRDYKSPEPVQWCRELLKEAADLAERYKYGKDAAQAILALME